jgi:hypothetical protein
MIDVATTSCQQENLSNLCAIVIPVKRLGILVLLLSLQGCAKSLERQIQDQVRTLDHAALGKKQVVVRNVQRMGDAAVAEVQVSTAVKLSKRSGKWIIEEIRLGDRRWEKVEHILELIEEKRSESSRQQMIQISSGIQRYAARTGEIPQVSDFQELMNLLSPEYLHEVVRIDAWSNPFFYKAMGESRYDLRSAGRDGRLRTDDDLITELR